MSSATTKQMLDDVRAAVKISSHNGGLELDANEEDFIESVSRRLARGWPLTDKQLAWLQRIWDRI